MNKTCVQILVLNFVEVLNTSVCVKSLFIWFLLFFIDFCINFIQISKIVFSTLKKIDHWINTVKLLYDGPR